MKFTQLRKAKEKSRRSVFWTKDRCEILARNYYLVDSNEIRRLVGGASLSNIRRQVKRLKDNGWTFQEKRNCT